MKISTYSSATLSNGHAVLSSDQETKQVAVNFTSTDYLRNFAVLILDAAAARALAIQLIEYAARVEPTSTAV